MNAPHPEVKTEVIEFAREELAGALLHLCVTQLEQLKTPWHLTSEKNQEIRLNKMRENIHTAVINAVTTIATERVPAIRVTIGKVSFEDEVIKTTLSLSRGAEGRHELADATGSTALIQLARPERFLTGAEKVKGQPDQPKLGLEPGASDPPAASGTEPAAPTDYAAAGTTDSGLEILAYQDGFMIYRDEMPIAGAKKFASHAEAETYVQDFLGIGKRESAFERVETPETPETLADAPPATRAYEDMKAGELRALIKERTGKGVSVSIKKEFLVQQLRDLDAAAAATAPAQDATQQQTEKTRTPVELKGELPDQNPFPSTAPAPVSLIEACEAFKAAGKAEAEGQREWERAWSEVVKNYPAEFVEEHYDVLTGSFTDGWEAVDRG